jgi:hypothetical protein
MDYVYFIREGDNEELRYSIRSVLKNTPNANIWVIGNKPDWYVGNFIPLPDQYMKFENIVECCRAAAYDDRVSDPFVWMNDDFFIVKPIESIPPLHRGPLLERADRYALKVSVSKYNRLLFQTYSKLVSLGIEDPLDYDVHTPLEMSKKPLREALEYGLLPRSFYGNLANIGGEKAIDVKVYHDRVNQFKSYDFRNGDSPFISTEDSSFKMVYDELLKDMFPDPSKYESP